VGNFFVGRPSIRGLSFLELLSLLARAEAGKDVLSRRRSRLRCSASNGFIEQQPNGDDASRIRTDGSGDHLAFFSFVQTARDTATFG
jgi:hypothetical protein